MRMSEIIIRWIRKTPETVRPTGHRDAAAEGAVPTEGPEIYDDLSFAWRPTPPVSAGADLVIRDLATEMEEILRRPNTRQGSSPQT